MSKRVRLRFAPSPTGGLHLGGVRTALYNYLFARKHDGDLILRIEDTDQGRYVPGSEEYIIETLKWCGLEPDEGPNKPGAFGPYRQSERKAMGIYEKYAQQLVKAGHAYYAFDTTEELEAMREKHKTADNPSPQYDHVLRRKMRNSLSLDAAETERLLAAGTPHVIRIRIEPDQEVRLTDLIRGEIVFQTDGVDDKVLLKADGMPTYHLAVVVDDRLMEISHAFRGEEWLPSAPVHVLLWRYLFGEDKMPKWAHLPLILKPDGNGKLSKRDGERLGIPIYALDWKDPKTGETTTGFRETGFLPEAFVNLLAMLGWNDGSGQEIFTKDELINVFSMDRVHKGGAKFDYEKARWFNHEWIKRLPATAYSARVLEMFRGKGVEVPEGDVERLVAGAGEKVGSGEREKDGVVSESQADLDIDAVEEAAEAMAPVTDVTGFPLFDVMTADPGIYGLMKTPLSKFERVLDMVKDRCTLLPDFVQQATFFFQAPTVIDLDSVRPKWSDAKHLFFVELMSQWKGGQDFDAAVLETQFKEMAAAAGIKPGDLLMPLRVMLVGAKFGPGVFEVASMLGREESISRIRYTLGIL
jgi:glutamyl-tRNA synthetase